MNLRFRNYDSCTASQQQLIEGLRDVPLSPGSWNRDSDAFAISSGAPRWWGRSACLRKRS